jgi:hypothetical protein
MFADFASLTPQEIEQLSRLSTMPEQLQNLNTDYTNAYGEENADGPTGRHVGRVFVAQNPLEQIGDILKKRQAKMTMDETRRKQMDIYRQQELARAMMMRQIGGGGAQGTAPIAENYMQTRDNLRGGGMI